MVVCGTFPKFKKTGSLQENIVYMVVKGDKNLIQKTLGEPVKQATKDLKTRNSELSLPPSYCLGVNRRTGSTSATSQVAKAKELVSVGSALEKALKCLSFHFPTNFYHPDHIICRAGIRRAHHDHCWIFGGPGSNRHCPRIFSRL